MTMKRSLELGGLTDNRVRAAMFYSRKRRLERERKGNVITGTPPSLAVLSNGVILSSAVSWGTYNFSNELHKQMKLNSGDWQTYVGGTVATTGQSWSVREIVRDALKNRSIFVSNTRIVS